MKIERYTFWDVIKKFQIVIPELQRDYAQGRTDVRTAHLRSRFVEALTHALESAGNPIHLDFVYGTQTEADATFVPIDGQQRLTTLYLLHYYLADKVEPQLQKFSYSTRPTSSAFCKTLGKNVLQLAKGKPSAFVKDAKWFKPEWNYDPTVQGMLVMLDAIHEKFKGCNRAEFWYMLTTEFGTDSRITFDFLDMKQANLSDDLYIKMNSRGKQLTDWENFKADLQKYVDEQKWNFSYSRPIDGEPNRMLDWKELIDTEWTDIFWKFKDKDNYLVDEEWMRFFRTMAIIRLGSQNLTGSIPKEQLDEFHRFSKKGDDFFSIDSFKSMGFLKEENLRYVFECLELLIGSTVFYYDDLLHNHLKIIAYRGSLETERFYILKRNLSKEAGLRSRLFLYAFVEGLRHVKGKSQSEADQHFVEWMRVWRNILQNADFSRDNFLATCRTICIASEKWHETGSPISFLTLANSEFSKIVQEQLKEEREKLEVLAQIENEESDSDRELFFATENHEIFQGQIGWLLNLARNEAGKFEQIFFNNLATNASKIFTKANLRNEKCLVHRSMLSKFDYSIDKTQNRWTYGHFGEGYNWTWKFWKNILSYNSLKEDRSIRLKKYILGADLIDLEGYFVNLINIFCRESYDSDYRIFLVQNPILFGWSELKQITWPENYNEADGVQSELAINILKKDTHRGQHREYFTFGLDQEFSLRKAEIDSFTNIYHEGQFAIQNNSYYVLKWKQLDHVPLEIYIKYDPKGYKGGHWFELKAKLNFPVMPELVNYFNSLAPKFSENSATPKSQGLDQIWFVSSETHSSVIETLKQISAEIKKITHAQLPLPASS